MVKNLPANAGDLSLILGGEDPLEKKMEATPVFLPGKSPGQRSLVGYSLWGRKELDATERTHTHHVQKGSSLFRIKYS